MGEADHTAAALRIGCDDEHVKVLPSRRLRSWLARFGCDAFAVVEQIVKRRLLWIRCERCGAVAQKWREQ